MNLNKEILKPDGLPSAMGYPTGDEIEALPLKDGKPDITKLPRETVKNVILKCLDFSRPTTPRDGMLVMGIAEKIREGSGEITLNLDLKWKLIEILKDQIYRETKEDGKTIAHGCYAGWAIVQVLQEMGEQYESPMPMSVASSSVTVFPPTVKTTSKGREK
jgi:hypothetical protein